MHNIVHSPGLMQSGLGLDFCGHAISECELAASACVAVMVILSRALLSFHFTSTSFITSYLDIDKERDG